MALRMVAKVVWFSIWCAMVVVALWMRERRARELRAWGASRAFCRSFISVLAVSLAVLFSFSALRCSLWP
jgi:hypothetical protein